MLVSADKQEGIETMTSVHPDIFDVIDSLTSIEAIWDVLYDYAQGFSIQDLTYYHLPPAGAQDIDNFFLASRGNETANLNAHKTALFDVGQSFIHCIRKLDRPITGHQLINKNILEADQLAFLKNMHLNERNSVLMVPTHGPRGRSGCFILVSNDPMKRFTQEDMRKLQWVCLTCHNLYAKLRNEKRNKIKKLTVREKQILTWVARGKSNSVIADIIGISQHTVNGYLRSIYLKTGTSDRTTAALRGIGEALIDL